ARQLPTTATERPGLNWIIEHFAVVFGVTLTLIVVVLILQQRRTPQSAVAWLLFVILVPYAAIPAFLALGFRKQGSRFPTIRFSTIEADGDASSPPSHADLEAVFRRFGLPVATEGNAFELIGDGQAAYAALME